MYMKNILMLTLLLILLMSFASATIDVNYFQDSDFVVSVYKQDSGSKNNVRAGVYFPYQEIYGRSSEFKLRSQQPVKLRYLMDIDTETPDYYPVIFTLENDDGFKVKTHTWIWLN